jgi:DHA3 family tetracycline resistance protein-like MFS transporter
MSARTPTRLRFLRALGSGPFALLWGGQTISALGDGAFSTALAWQVLLLTGSATAMGLVVAAQVAPTVLFILLGGVAADRLPRRLVLFVVDSGRAVVVLAIAALAWMQVLQLWHLVVLALFFGIVGSFFYPAYRAMPPQLVEKDDLASANSLTELSWQLGRLAGPVLGAALVALANPAGAFAFDGLTFVVSAATLFFIRLKPSPQADTSPAPEGGSVVRRGARLVWADLRDGMGYVLASPWLVITIAVPAIGNVLGSAPLLVVLPRLIADVYHEGVWLLGGMATAQAIGLIAATFIVGQVRLRRRGLVAFGSMVFASLAGAALGVPWPHASVAYIALGAAVVIGLGGGMLQTIWITLLHELVPNEKLGRVASIDLVGSIGLMPPAYAVSGLLADRFGPALVFLVGGALKTALYAGSLLTHAVREVD